jgi:hypothetical protein
MPACLPRAPGTRNASVIQGVAERCDSQRASIMRAVFHGEVQFSHAARKAHLKLRQENPQLKRARDA